MGQSADEKDLRAITAAQNIRSEDNAQEDDDSIAPCKLQLCVDLKKAYAKLKEENAALRIRVAPGPDTHQTHNSDGSVCKEEAASKKAKATKAQKSSTDRLTIMTYEEMYAAQQADELTDKTWPFWGKVSSACSNVYERSSKAGKSISSVCSNVYERMSSSKAGKSISRACSNVYELMSSAARNIYDRITGTDDKEKLLQEDIASSQNPSKHSDDGDEDVTLLQRYVEKRIDPIEKLASRSEGVKENKTTNKRTDNGDMESTMTLSSELKMLKDIQEKFLPIALKEGKRCHFRKKPAEPWMCGVLTTLIMDADGVKVTKWVVKPELSEEDLERFESLG